jgi:hypothetical protein
MERPGNTLRTTAPVSGVCLRPLDARHMWWQDRLAALSGSMGSVREAETLYRLALRTIG